jgi:hypothetical protein
VFLQQKKPTSEALHNSLLIGEKQIYTTLGTMLGWLRDKKHDKFESGVCMKWV